MMEESMSEKLQADINRLRAELMVNMTRRNVNLVDIDSLLNINDVIERDMGINDWISTYVSKVAGSIWFAYFLIVFSAAWMGLNVWIVSSGGTPFDTPYEFPILLFGTNFIQLLLPVFIVVNQRSQERREKMRAERDHLLMQLGKRDNLVMFSYLSEFADTQEKIQQELDTNQKKLIAMEQMQRQSSGDVIPDLIQVLRDLQYELSERPCILHQYPDMVREIFDDAFNNDNSEGDD